MNKYRIIEKKGEYKKTVGQAHPMATTWECQSISSAEKYLHLCSCNEGQEEVYIPKYFLQVQQNNNLLPWTNIIEFSNLEEARKIKRERELEDGIVIE